MANQREHAWTPEQDATLLRLRTQGLTCKQMATRFPFLRGYKCDGRYAVVGRLWRLDNPRPKKPREERGKPIDPNSVLAAAIVMDGGSYEEAMEETGLDWQGVYRAVLCSRNRDYRDRKRMEAADASR